MIYFKRQRNAFTLARILELFRRVEFDLTPRIINLDDEAADKIVSENAVQLASLIRRELIERNR